MSSPGGTPSIDAIKSDSSLNFSPDTARAIAQHCNSAAASFETIWKNAQSLINTGSAGNFDSAGNIQRSLQALGESCINSVRGLRENARDLGDAVRAAGQRIQTQDEEVSNSLKSTSDKAGGYPPIGQPATGASDCRPSDPIGKDAFLGRFPCEASAENSPGGGVVEWGFGNSQPANPVSLNALVTNWMSVARDIAATAAALDAGISGVLANGTWTGTAADGVRAGSRSVADIATSTGKNAFVNANVVAGWVAAVIGTQSGFNGLKSRLETENHTYNTVVMASGVNPSAVQRHQEVVNALDQQGRMIIDNTYNPGATKTSTSLLNLPDPGSPIGTIMPMGFSRSSGGGGSGSAGSGAAATGGGGGAGGTGGGGGGSGPGPAGNRTGSDAAQTLSRQGSGDPAVAATNASKNAAAQSGQGNPASAAQSAMSKAGDATKGLGSKGGASPLTRSAGLGSLADSEKSAAAKAASALGKGGGAGGGGAGGGGGIGKMGGAGIAAAEGSLSARSAAGLSAAERAMAAPQAAPAATRPGMSPGMGGARGAHGGGGENEKEHKSARYLISGENGEEIAGELPDTAPPVLGGLNLDTTDSPDTTR